MFVPFFFPYFKNELSSSQQNTHTFLYADETAVLISALNASLTQEQQTALSKTERWLKENTLILNINKTKTMKFQKSKQKIFIEARVNKSDNEYTKSFGYLGKQDKVLS